MKSILVVDDEPHVNRVMKLRLEEVGYRVEIASNGEEALEKLREESFDAMITDVLMPRMTGRELCQRIRKELPDVDLLIFVITSSSEIEHRDWVKEVPRAELIEKPVSPKRLIAYLRRGLEGESGEQGA
ncbi:MAG: response regulator [Myxococcota bacterium]